MWARKQTAGFTLVELLVVIVVIAILAAIAIVAYSGITQRTRQAAVDSSLMSVAKKIQLYSIDNAETYPSTLSNIGVTNSSTASYRYSFDNSVTPRTYCLTALSGTSSSYVDQTGRMQSGSCPGQDASAYTTNLVPNPSFENNVDDWEAFGNATIERVCDQADTGKCSLKVTPDQATTNSGARLKQTVAVQVGKQYTASIKFRPTGTDTADDKVRSRINLNNSAIATGIPNTWSLGFTETASPLSSTASSGGMAVSFWYLPVEEGEPGYGSGKATRQPFYIDSVLFREKVSGETNGNYAYRDGSYANWIWNGSPGNSISVGPRP